MVVSEQPELWNRAGDGIYGGANNAAEGPAAAEWRRRRRGWRAEGEADRNTQQLIESTGTHDLDTTLQTARRTALSSDSFGGEWYAASAARRLGDGLAPTPAGCLLNQTIAARAPSLRSVVTASLGRMGTKNCRVPARDTSKNNL